MIHLDYNSYYHFNIGISSFNDESVATPTSQAMDYWSQENAITQTQDNLFYKFVFASKVRNYSLYELRCYATVNGSIVRLVSDAKGSGYDNDGRRYFILVIPVINYNGLNQLNQIIDSNNFEHSEYCMYGYPITPPSNDFSFSESYGLVFKIYNKRTGKEFNLKYPQSSPPYPLEGIYAQSISGDIFFHFNDKKPYNPPKPTPLSPPISIDSIKKQNEKYKNIFEESKYKFVEEFEYLINPKDEKSRYLYNEIDVGGNNG